MMNQFKCFLVFLTVSGACASLHLDPLGQGFFLPNEDINGPHHGGKSIFKNLDPKCCKWIDQDKKTVDSRTYFENTETFYTSLATDTGLSVHLKGPYTMGATLGIKTNYISGGSVDVKGTLINIWTHINTSYLDADCYKGPKIQLVDDLIQNLNFLPVEVKQPELKSSWIQYDNFLKTYGSHFVAQTFYGASIKQYTFSKQEKSYNEHQLKARSCANFEGLTKVGKLNVSTCAGVTQKEAEEAMKLDMSSYLDIRGGSDETRSLLRNDRSDELITKLLNEGRELQTKVDYKYTAIWDVLTMRFYDNATLHAKALNLKQYYEGLLDFGCSLVEVANSWQVRRFRTSNFHTKWIPDYQCVLERDGCHSGSDCQIGVPGTVTYCYGPSCIEHLPPPFGTKAMSAQIRYNQQGSHWEGINESCYWKFPFIADCQIDWSHQKVIWSGINSYVSMMAFYNLPPPNFGNDSKEAVASQTKVEL